MNLAVFIFHRGGKAETAYTTRRINVNVKQLLLQLMYVSQQRYKLYEAAALQEGDLFHT